jgi:chorismate mutase
MSTESVPAELLYVREQIDRIDHGLVLLLANRFALTQRVGVLKAQRGLEALDPERESRKLAEIRRLCESHGVEPDLVAEILARVMAEVVKNHKAIRDAGGSLA